MNLQGVVGTGPCHAGTKKFGHPSFKVAALVIVFLPCAEIGQLPGDHDFHCHHGELRHDAREFNQRFAELLAVLGIFHANFQRRLCHANGARACLDAGGFKGLHQLLEALALNTAKKIICRNFEPVKGQLVFFHAAVTENLDLTAGHAGGREGGFISAGGLFGQKHRQATIVGGVGVGAGQERHHMGARGMGDPCLVAGDFPALLGPHRAGAQRAKV